MGDYAFYRDSTVLLELNIPDRYCLLSSYFIWNEAVDDMLENKRATIADAKFDSMFDEPLIRHDTDDVQAVIPRIALDWIANVKDLPEHDSGWDTQLPDA